MNRNDFRNPLIQSGILLLCAFILISIVVNSPANGFFSGIAAIFIAIIKGVLFIFGLSIALVLSIAVLVGIYLAATYFYSSDKAGVLLNQLKEKSTSFYSKVSKCKIKRVQDDKVSENAQPDQVAQPETTTKVSESPLLDNRITAVEQQIDQLRTSIKKNHGFISSIQLDFEKFKKDRPKVPVDHESKTENSNGALDNYSETINTITRRLEKNEQQIDVALQSLKKEITELREKTVVPEMVSGILSYIDTPADREKLTKKVEEAVSRGMTYSQADELFKKSLPAKIFKILAEHPRLTKDFIRSVKKKFA